jgi:hypothetical protein
MLKLQHIYAFYTWKKKLLGTISKHDAPSVLERAIQAFNQIIFQSFRYAPNDTPIVTSNDRVENKKWSSLHE